MSTPKPPPASRGIRNASAGIWRRIADRAFRPRESQVKEKRQMPRRAKFGKVPTTRPPGVPTPATEPMLRRPMSKDEMSLPPAPTRRPPDPIQPMPSEKILRPGKPRLATVELSEKSIRALTYGLMKEQPFKLGHLQPQDVMERLANARPEYFFAEASINSLATNYDLIVAPENSVRVVSWVRVNGHTAILSASVQRFEPASVGTGVIQIISTWATTDVFQELELFPADYWYSLPAGERIGITNASPGGIQFRVRGFFLDIPKDRPLNRP